MRPLVFSVLSLFIMLGTAKAQYVTIPDTNFVTYLQATYPTCMVGNQMDTTCAAILNADELDISHKDIYDETGIQYFKNVWYLVMVANNIDTLDTPLPPNLEQLSASFCNMDAITVPFPSSLLYLYISHNNLSALPPLPAGLYTFDIVANEFTEVPPLPNNIWDFACTGNDSLRTLPTLPSGLRNLSAGECNIDSLPMLPNTITDLYLADNRLTHLPNIPTNCKDLNINTNLFDSLQALPNGLEELRVSYNQLTSLPELPQSLTDLWCISNNLTSLPELPDTMYDLYVINNPINCLPELKTINRFYWSGTNVTCVPNSGNITSSIPNIYTYPICDIFNSNGCEWFYNIAGRTYTENNTNCLLDPSETTLAGIKVNVYRNGQLDQQVFTDPGGHYTFDMQNTTGTYVTQIDTTAIPFRVSCPSSGFDTNTITFNDTLFTARNFGLECKTSIDVGAHNLVRDPGWLRPGSTQTFRLLVGPTAQFYNATCPAPISGEVTAILDGPFTINSFAGLTPNIINGDTLTWIVADFDQVDIDSSFVVIVDIDTSAQASDLICFDIDVATSTPDAYPANDTFNTCFAIVNSYDPNNKIVHPVADIDTSQEWLYYTVNFQNTGNAPALHIQIRDTLSQYLDWGSLQLLSYSHSNYTEVSQNGEVAFIFANINLPDSTNNEPESHGYVSYKIKVLDNLPLNTVIENTAHIYFDFNPAIVTNTTANRVTILDPCYQSFITPAGLPTINSIAATDPNCGVSNGEIEIMASGGIADLTYSINGGTNFQPDSSFNGLNVGVYNIVISDSLDCRVDTSIIMSNIGGPIIDQVIETDATCDLANGALNVSSVLAGAQPYFYAIDESNYQISPIFTGLDQGEYHIYVRDANNCVSIARSYLTRSQSPVIDSLIAMDLSCADNDGTIAVHISKGTGPFTYSINGGSSSQPDPLLTGLSSGSYTVLVTDSLNCTDTATTLVTEMPSPVITDITLVSPTCGYSNGTITVSASGGTFPLKYGKFGASGFFQTDSILRSINEGPYTVAVQDANGCLASSLVDTNVTPVNSGSPIIDGTFTHPTCGNNDGTISLTYNGGTPPYTFSVDNGATYYNDSLFTGLASGWYNARVKDSLDCYTRKTFVLVNSGGPGTPLISHIDTVQPHCQDGVGEIHISASGGVGALTYSISNYPSQNDSSFTDLNGGTYNIRVTGTNGCSALDTVALHRPLSYGYSRTHPSCVVDGSIRINTQGRGLEPIRYTIDNGATFQNDDTFDSLTFGTYRSYAIDSLGCRGNIYNISLYAFNSPYISSINSPLLQCGDTSNGSMTINAYNNDGPFSYSIDGGANFSPSKTFTNLGPDIYDIVVKDTSGCVLYEKDTILESPFPIIDSLVITPPVCAGTSTTYGGRVWVYASSPVNTGFQYSYNNGASWSNSWTYNGLTPGIKNISVRSFTQGCRTDTQIVVTLGSPLGFTDVELNQPGCTNTAGSISILAYGGNGPLSYSIDNGTSFQSTSFYDTLTAGTYNIRVKDSIGCIIDTAVTLANTQVPVIDSIVSTDVDCNNTGGSITINATSSIPLNYSIDNGNAFQLSNTFTGVLAGTYSIIVSDTLGCQVNSQVTISNSSTAAAINVTTTNASCGINNGVINISAVSGTAPFQFSMDNGASFSADSSFASIAPGTYSVVVIDAQGCTDTVSATISNIGNPSNLTIDTTICFGESYIGHSSSGIYVDTFSVSGCDSIRTLNLTVLPQVITYDATTICYGSSYMGYSATGIYMDTFATSSCDSFRELDLTVLPLDTTAESVTICSGSTYAGYNTTGIYIDTFSASGCDSIRTLNLTVLPQVITYDAATICYGSSYMGYLATGIYVDTFATLNCDSIRELDLTVLPLDTTAEIAIICSGDTYAGYDTTGIYVDTFTNIAGCDSIRTIDLSVLQQTLTPVAIQLCMGDSTVINGQTVTLAGTYFDTLVMAANCPIEVLEYTVTVQGLPNDTVIVHGVNFAQLEAIAENATFQWLHCGNADPVVEDSTNSTFWGEAYNQYAVIITDTITGCVDTSDCYSVLGVGVTELDLFEATVIPNPTSGQFQIKLNRTLHGRIKVINTLGQTIYTNKFDPTKYIAVDLDLQTGLYYVVIETATGNALKKLIVE